MENKNTTGGVGIVTITTLVFFILKVLEVIDWSWWWVLSPLWISAAVFIIVLIVSLIILAVRQTRQKMEWEEQKVIIKPEKIRGNEKCKE